MFISKKCICTFLHSHIYNLNQHYIFNLNQHYIFFFCFTLRKNKKIMIILEFIEQITLSFSEGYSDTPTLTAHLINQL